MTKITLPDLASMKHTVVHFFTKVGEEVEPKCDFCKTPQRERPRYSDGVGIMACQKCWDSVDKIDNPYVATQHSVARLVESLEWLIQEDDTYRGGEWEQKNAYWIEGLERAREALAIAKDESYERDDSWDNLDEDHV